MKRSAWLPMSFAVLLAIFVGFTPVAAQPSRTFTLQPTGKATVTFIAFCTEFGDKYPSQLTLPSDLAKPEVRSALQYIADNNLASDQNKALQGQFAIWKLLNQPGPAGDALTQQVITFANANKVSDPQGTSLLTAANNKQIRLTLQSWVPASPVVQITSTASDNFYGRGTLLVENISQQPLTLYMPIGTLFAPTVQSHQTMAGFLTDLSVTNPKLPNTSGNTLPLVIATALLGLAGVVRLLRVWRGARTSS